MMGNDNRRHSIMQMHLHRYAFHSLRALLILVVNLLWALPTLATTLTTEQAYQKGKILHFQDRFEEAEPYLLQAGESGNASAYYLLANAGNPNRYLMGEKEYKYKKLAADNGHLAAMIGLIMPRSISPKKTYWRNQLLEILKPEIKNNNPLAMQLKNIMPSTGEDVVLSDVKNAAYAGHPRAQYFLARRYENGEGWFLLPGSREKEVAKLYEASARGGYHDAIWYLGYEMIEAGEIDAGVTKIQSLVDKGAAQTLSTYGILLTNINPDPRQTWKQIDKIRGATYLKAVKDSMSAKSKDGLYQDLYRYAKEDLSDEEIKQGDILAEEYLRTHTVYRQDGLDEYEYTVDNLHTALERWGGNAIE
ncbi:hypothetical protein [Enterovibrio norvegicus]|uniref:hypothetical protein n=1 Tax=Enterovibrio norvegicus TaxID=188144 RepID=UPI0024B16D65|nr:hypothetical protein [Enterovibrio norvegicus]